MVVLIQIAVGSLNTNSKILSLIENLSIQEFYLFK